MKKSIVFTVPGALLSSFAFAGSAAAAPSVPDWAQISSVVAAGSGCPSGSVSWRISGDRRTISITFQELDARVGAGLPPAEGNAFCGFTVTLDRPAGWKYSLASALHRGRADLSSGVVGQQTLTYWFLGQTRQATTSKTLTGPFHAPFVRHDRFGASELVWSPCGANRPLKIDEDVSVSNLASPGASGRMQLKEVTYTLLWARC